MAALLDDSMLLVQTIYQILQLRPEVVAASTAAADTGGHDTAPMAVIEAISVPQSAPPADPWTTD